MRRTAPRYSQCLLLTVSEQTLRLQGITYVVVLRDPIDRIISNWLHDSSNDADLPAFTNFSEYVSTFVRHEFAVRSLCGPACISAAEITLVHYLQVPMYSFTVTPSADGMIPAEKCDLYAHVCFPSGDRTRPFLS